LLGILGKSENGCRRFLGGDLGRIEWMGIVVAVVLLVLAAQRYFGNKRRANGRRDPDA